MTVYNNIIIIVVIAVKLLMYVANHKIHNIS